MILLRNPHGNLITPSQGDRGVDIQVESSPGTFDIYQVKRYPQRLTGSQKGKIARSWRTFLEQTAPQINISSWNLVLPCDPTHENLEWFKDLTAESGIKVNWIGRTQLDGWASDMPKLVEYFFGDGRTRAEELLERVLALVNNNQSINANSGSTMLDGLLSKVDAISVLLDEVDPFYRYDYEVHHGHIDENADAASFFGSGSHDAFTVCAQIDSDERYLVLHVIPRCRESAQLSPISMDMTLKADSGTAQYEALQNFVRYGVPPQNIDVDITNVVSPPGGLQPGHGTISLFDVPGNDTPLPPLELALTPSADEDTVAVNIERLTAGSGIKEGGWHLTLIDEARVFELIMLFAPSRKTSTFQFRRADLTGRIPSEVISSLQFLRRLSEGGCLDLRVRGDGKVLLSLESSDAEDVRAKSAYGVLVEYVGALAEVQKHVVAPIRIPSLEVLTGSDIDEIVRASRLLRGEQLTATWDHVGVVPRDADNFPASIGEEQVIINERGFYVSHQGQQYDTGRKLRVVYESAQLVTADRSQDDGQMHFVPGHSNRAVVVLLPEEGVAMEHTSAPGSEPQQPTEATGKERPQNQRPLA
ncbi:hypothetical protein SAMN04487766_106186 [Actinomyces ruminicola]|uniref:Uncharacterized protein n=2 Tax=Actinomyces ruminicola TaxID=332524 RepID=A0A1G9VYK8_9ACTO|nr:hypothetical protein SAMN04487766_106186 [Actinomyces ruminicola]